MQVSPGADRGRDGVSQSPWDRLERACAHTSSALHNERKRTPVVRPVRKATGLPEIARLPPELTPALSQFTLPESSVCRVTSFACSPPRSS